jgi:hypothetical protein
MNEYGFIITRHVNSELTNKYWNNCVQCIRRFYPYRKIVIIDDNSNSDLVIPFKDYDNIEIIQSEFHGRGELLPYYYYIKRKFFDNAVIIHDSVFFHTRVNFEKLIGVNVLPLWHFNEDTENYTRSLEITRSLKNSEQIKRIISPDVLLLGNLKKEKWYGCFGCQCFINLNFLISLEHKYSITNMVKQILCRPDRCCLERIFGVMFFTNYSAILHKKSIFGNIHKNQNWGYTFEQYLNDVKKGNINFIIKVWTGR